MSKDNINEEGSAGSTGAGAIASSPTRQGTSTRHGEHEWKDTLTKEKADRAKSAHTQDQLRKAKELKAAREKEEKLKKRSSFTNFFRRKVSEEFDMGSVVSQLKGIQHSSSDNVSAAVSYGIEDDKGNFMRVTVRSDQAKEFEMTIARKMADNKDNSVQGLNDQKGSLAEILFDLQNQFDIMDVEFPMIPKDAVYNAGDATVGQAPVGAQSGTTPPTDDLGMGMGDDSMGSDMNDMSGTGDQSLSGTDDMGGTSGDMGAGADMTGGFGDTETDADNVENFGDESTSDSDPASLLKSLVDMLKKQAEAETAKANAMAEQSRATQAEWSAIAANKDVERQEELARVEADLQEKKRREKQAKQYADIAKYNVRQGKDSLNKMGEGMEIEDSFLYSAMLEDAYDNTTALQKAKQEVIQKYKINPNDDPLDKNYKAAAMRLETTQLNARIQLATLTDQYNKQKQTQTQQTQPNQQNQQQTQQQTQTQPQGQPQNNSVGQPQGGVGNGGI